MSCCLSENELVAIWRIADCPFQVEQLSEGARVTWSDDPLDFIDLAPKAIDQLIERLQAVKHGL